MSVAKCANPKCEAEFRRLGTGKLYIKTLKGSRQKAAWLCKKCQGEGFDLSYDRKSEGFHLHRRKAA